MLVNPSRNGFFLREHELGTNLFSQGKRKSSMHARFLQTHVIVFIVQPAYNTSWFSVSQSISHQMQVTLVSHPSTKHIAGMNEKRQQEIGTKPDTPVPTHQKLFLV